MDQYQNSMDDLRNTSRQSILLSSLNRMISKPTISEQAIQYIIEKIKPFIVNRYKYLIIKSIYGEQILSILENTNDKISQHQFSSSALLNWSSLISSYEKVSKIKINTIQIDHLQQKLKREKEIQNINQNLQHIFIQNLHNQRHMPNNYLCCSEFCYQSYNLCGDQQNYDIKIISNSSRIDNTQILQSFVAFLNSKGGIIIFDCQEECKQGNKSIIANGAQLTQLKKQQIQQKIASFVENISPKITYKQHYEISYIPVKVNPQKNQLDSSGVRPFIKGRFIIRILVFPLNPQLTYHFTFNNNQTAYFYVRKDGLNLQIDGSNIHDLIVQRYKINKGKSYRHCHNQKLITLPLKGASLYEDANKPQNLQQKNIVDFKFCSLLICDKQAIVKISQLLFKAKIQYCIVESFPGYNFRLSCKTFLIQHQVKFDKLKITLGSANLKYQNGTKPVMMISTAMSVQTVPLTPDEVNNLQKWLIGCFPQQKITTIKENNELYLKTQTYLGSIFLYFLLDNFGVRSRFKKIHDNSLKIKQPQKKSTI